VAKDPERWNEIVNRSAYSVLHHRYELNAVRNDPLPLLISEQNHRFLFPLNTAKIFRSFRVATSPIYSYASLLPESENSIHLIPRALDCVTDFLRNMNVDYLSTCAPMFWSKPYVTLINSWFERHEASVQILYAHMFRTRKMTFEEVWKRRFDKHARYNVRRAEREGVEVIEIENEEDIRKWKEDIYRCNISALKRQGREGAFPDSFKEVYFRELALGKKLLRKYLKIYGAFHSGRLIAYMIVQAYNKLMEVSKAMSHTDFLDKRPNDALIAHLTREACEKGFELLEYGLERTGLRGKIPSLHPTLEMFRFKFGFEEVPIVVYRLGLTRSGRILQYLFSGREYFVTRYASAPSLVRRVMLRLYAPRRRELSVFLST